MLYIDCKRGLRPLSQSRTYVIFSFLTPPGQSRPHWVEPAHPDLHQRKVFECPDHQQRQTIFGGTLEFLNSSDFNPSPLKATLNRTNTSISKFDRAYTKRSWTAGPAPKPGKRPWRIVQKLARPQLSWPGRNRLRTTTHSPREKKTLFPAVRLVPKGLTRMTSCQNIISPEAIFLIPGIYCGQKCH